MGITCPECQAGMEWECARRAAPDGIVESHYRCPDHQCDIISVRITGRDY